MGACRHIKNTVVSYVKSFAKSKRIPLQLLTLKNKRGYLKSEILVNLNLDKLVSKPYNYQISNS